MRLGQVVDFCVAYNERNHVEEQQEGPEKKKPTKRRIGTQEDIDARLG